MFTSIERVKISPLNAINAFISSRSRVKNLRCFLNRTPEKSTQPTEKRLILPNRTRSQFYCTILVECPTKGVSVTRNTFGTEVWFKFLGKQILSPSVSFILAVTQHVTQQQMEKTQGNAQSYLGRHATPMEKHCVTVVKETR